MNLMFLSLDLLVVSCLFVTVEPITGEVFTPQNVSILWVDDFHPKLSWEPPPQYPVPNQCQYNLNVSTDENGTDRQTYKKVSSPWTEYFTMKGFLKFSLKALCNNTEGKPVVVRVNYTDLVKNFECYSDSRKHAFCSWSSASPAKDLRFYYQCPDDNCNLTELQECSRYNYTDGVRTGCHLDTETHCHIDMLLNGTLDNKPVRNTFKKLLTEKVRPPPLMWTVTKSVDKFNLNWTPPDLINLESWKFIINYTVCDKNKTIEIHGKRSYDLEVTPHCPHRIALKAWLDNGETPWTEEKYFEADRDPNAFVYPIALAIPLVFSILAVGIFVCWRKNKDRIFPKVPAPVDFLTSISDNNNKKTLYVPTEDVESCNISLVMESNTGKQFD
ncbi:uncharacterized protein LOC125022285 [Mugil cephalus]|uniref:uncharacterized protein LOC125022285 n=1 Tax=Mugil cephalus TaxID=48193 RepID=UPI001FB6209D|nr:uncharacterized protein LOC125022285 [Mugil cephalus]